MDGLGGVLGWPGPPGGLTRPGGGGAPPPPLILAAVERALQHLLEAFHLEWLLQHRPIAVGAGHTALAITGGKNERHAAGDKRVGDRQDGLDRKSTRLNSSH